MKLSLLPLISLFLISGTPSEDCFSIKEFNLEKQGLKGRVKSLREYYYYDVEKNYETGKWETDEHIIEVYSTFSEEGIEQEYTNFDKHGVIMSRYLPYFENGCFKGFKEYNDSNQLVSHFIITEMRKEKDLLFVEFTEQHAPGDAPKKNRVYYDPLIRPVHMISFEKDGTRLSETYREYDSNNYIVYEKFCHKSDSCGETKTEYIEFDSKGNWTQKLLARKYPYYTSYSIVNRRLEYYE